MSDKSWKKHERRIAKAFGTLRNSLSGRMSKAGTSSDTLHERFYIECKRRKTIAMLEWFAEIVPKAMKERKIPILALKSANHKDDYIVMRLRDLERG